MNRYVRALICVPYGEIKMGWTKLFHLNNFVGPQICLIDPLSEITLDRKGKLTIGNMFKMRDGAKIRVRDGAECIIGVNTSINTNNIIACHERIEIGNNVQLSPNVQIYDHDHDFRYQGGGRDLSGISAMKYRTSPVKIGNNVWIGANSTILRGTVIGDNAVIGAGSIVNGYVEPNTVFVQKRENKYYQYQYVK